ncbi:Protein NRT1/ PTR FAMILY 5.10 [Dichanthelium oligosanthes]|uniref:Protein NRT1/ PTR FAMILY 5.10 n=1 Tax=Dichanthelium oligosanthes TaxID=888268 RepID=A0A1E5WDG7_9POAL|nr:Protein NRT1/ PTR FAMILY 5.10 [Dichanthelium oligosanthes]
MESGELLPRAEPSVGSKPGRRGGWLAAFFLIAVVFFERIGFYGVEGNLIMYLTSPLGMSTATAAAGVNAWSGTVLVLPLVGALAADSRLGRYGAVMAASVLYLLSLGMLTASSALQTSQPHPPSSTTPPARLAFFYAALYLLALAQGFHRPCAEALGADQFAPTEPASRSSYFNWFHFFVSWGYAIAAAGISYVEENAGWTVGFGACWVTMVLCLAVFLLGTRTYRAEEPADRRLLADTVRAWVASMSRRKDTIGTERDLCRLLARDAEEEGAGLVSVKLLPIWLTSVVFALVISQVTTLFTKQGSTMDRRIGTSGFAVPPAALISFISVSFVIMVPVYDRALVPLARRLTGHHAGITTLQRIGSGIAVSCLAMAVAAVVEARRLRVASDAGLADRPDVAVPMSLWWIVPQYLLIGLARVLAAIGLEEFFYDQVPAALRSVGVALSLSALGVGSYASGAVVSAIDWATRGSGESWFSDNLNRAHLDYFYWLLAGLAALDVAVFFYFANRYVYRNKG